MSILGEPILVTGGAGYIGSHVCKALYALGCMPVTLDNLVRGRRDFAKWGPLEIGDIADGEFVQHCLEVYKPKAVLHLAGYGFVNESMHNPRLYYRNNLMATLNLLDSIVSKQNKPIPIVFASSCTVYDDTLGSIAAESMMPNPKSVYGKTKLACEEAILTCMKAANSSAIILRYFNAAGADIDCEIGELPGDEVRLIPRVISVAHSIDDVLRIYGDEFPTGDGTAIRDYIHVEDIAQANILALLRVLEGNINQTINIGSGVGHSIKEVVSAVERITNNDVRLQFSQKRENEAAAIVADIDLAKEILNFSPSFSDLDRIIESAWRWHLNVTKRGVAIT